MPSILNAGNHRLKRHELSLQRVAIVIAPFLEDDATSFDLKLRRWLHKVAAKNALQALRAAYHGTHTAGQQSRFWWTGFDDHSGWKYSIVAIGQRKSDDLIDGRPIGIIKGD